MNRIITAGIIKWPSNGLKTESKDTMYAMIRFSRDLRQPKTHVRAVDFKKEFVIYDQQGGQSYCGVSVQVLFIFCNDDYFSYVSL